MNLTDRFVSTSWEGKRGRGGGGGGGRHILPGEGTTLLFGLCARK